MFQKKRSLHGSDDWLIRFFISIPIKIILSLNIFRNTFLPITLPCWNTMPPTPGTLWWRLALTTVEGSWKDCEGGLTLRTSLPWSPNLRPCYGDCRCVLLSNFIPPSISAASSFPVICPFFFHLTVEYSCSIPTNSFQISPPTMPLSYQSITQIWLHRRASSTLAIRLSLPRGLSTTSHSLCWHWGR